MEITEDGVDKLSFVYNDNNSRSAMFYGSTNTDKNQRPNRKYYSADGSMEIKITPAGTEFVTYIGGDGYSAPVVYKKTFTAGNAQEQMLYLHRDYQGSILAITNEVGTIVEKRLFDAWGSLLSIQNGSSQPIANGQWLLDRGYTGHEHLLSVGLIHMNGRLYDPKLHRFLQPDNYVQDPSNTQNYNRYSYVLNNPLKYTDYSGEKWKIGWKDVVGGLQVVVGAVLLFVPGAQLIGGGLLLNGLSYFASTYEQYKVTGDWASASANSSIMFGYQTKTDWGYDSKSDKNGIAQNEPVVKPETIAKDDVRNMSSGGGKGKDNSIINSMQNFYNSNQAGLRDTFNKAEITGGTMEMVGGITAIFTEGAGLGLAADGAKLSLIGTAGNVIMDGIEGEWGSAFNRTAEFGLYFGMGRAIKSGVPQKTLQNSLNAFQAYFSTYVMPIFEDSWNKFNTPKK